MSSDLKGYELPTTVKIREAVMEGTTKGKREETSMRDLIGEARSVGVVSSVKWFLFWWCCTTVLLELLQVMMMKRWSSIPQHRPYSTSTTTPDQCLPPGMMQVSSRNNHCGAPVWSWDRLSPKRICIFKHRGHKAAVFSFFVAYTIICLRFSLVLASRLLGWYCSPSYWSVMFGEAQRKWSRAHLQVATSQYINDPCLWEWWKSRVGWMQFGLGWTFFYCLILWP